MIKKGFFVGFILLTFSVKAQVKVLFDATKAEMSGNGDWVIDADVHNIGTNSSGAMVAGFGDESNPQQIPTAPQSGITALTPETYWEGALSSWGIDLVRYGFTVETLPITRSITYGNSSNPQDLSHYKVFIVDEPNILFTATEKTALLTFVNNGGGLFMISDHTVSDRNNDGFDSPDIWNDFMTTNSVQANPFGISFNLQNFSQTATVIVNDPSDSIIHGRAGVPTGLIYNSGTSIMIDHTANANSKGLIFKNGSSSTGLTNILFARSAYGSGRVCALGDSSPIDDGTGDPNDVLYSSYSSVLSGSHKKLLINAVIWLAQISSINSVDEIGNNEMYLYPVPAGDHLSLNAFDVICHYTICDISGRNIQEGLLDRSGIDIAELNSGYYFITLVESGNKSKTLRFIKK